MESVLCQNRIVLGRIISPYGVRGCVKIRSYTEEIDGLMSYQPLWVDKGGLKPLIRKLAFGVNEIFLLEKMLCQGFMQMNIIGMN